MARDTVHFFVAMLVGFAMGCAIIRATVSQPLAVARPSLDMAVQLQPALASPSKFMQPMQPIRARASSVIANAESQADPGRRQMMAGAFGLAAAVSNRAALAEGFNVDKVDVKPMEEEKLPPAGDYTRFDSVVTKPGFVPTAKKEKAGDVEVVPALIPAVIVGSAVVSAGVPALLSPGQEAKDAQDRQRSSVGKKPVKKFR